eukprot:gene4713-18573_t
MHYVMFHVIAIFACTGGAAMVLDRQRQHLYYKKMMRIRREVSEAPPAPTQDATPLEQLCTASSSHMGNTSELSTMTLPSHTSGTSVLSDMTLPSHMSGTSVLSTMTLPSDEFEFGWELDDLAGAGSTVYCSTCKNNGDDGPTEGCAECGAVDLDTILDETRNLLDNFKHNLDVGKYKSKVIHIAIPRSDPNEMEEGALEILRDQLADRFGGSEHVEMATRGDADEVPPAEWLKWLQLPWPKDGADVMVQVDDHVHSFHWAGQRQGVSSRGNPSTRSASRAPHKVRLHHDANSHRALFNPQCHYERFLLTDVHPLVSVVEAEQQVPTQCFLSCSLSGNSNCADSAAEGCTSDKLRSGGGDGGNDVSAKANVGSITAIGVNAPLPEIITSDELDSSGGSGSGINASANIAYVGNVSSTEQDKLSVKLMVNSRSPLGSISMSAPRLKARFHGLEVPITVAACCEDEMDTSCEGTTPPSPDAVDKSRPTYTHSATLHLTDTLGDTPFQTGLAACCEDEMDTSCEGTTPPSPDAVDKSRPTYTHSVILHLTDALGETPFQPGLAVLEVWVERVVVQSIPLLLLSPQLGDLATELGSRCLRTETNNNDALDHPRESFTAKMGLWLGYLARMKNIISGRLKDARQADRNTRTARSSHTEAVSSKVGLVNSNAGEVPPEQYADLHAMSITMVGMAQALLEYAIANAWVAVSAELMHALVEGGNSEGFTLLHLAVSSGKCAMIAQACSKHYLAESSGKCAMIAQLRPRLVQNVTYVWE